MTVDEANTLLLGHTVRDSRTGLVGRVIGVVTWEAQPPSLIVQPAATTGQTLPPTAYVPEASVSVLGKPYPSRERQ